MLTKPILFCAVLSSLLGLLTSYPAPASPVLFSAPTVVVDPITVVSPLGNAVNPAPELIFSGTKNATSASQSVVIRNDQTTSVTITDIALSGTNAAAFTLTGSPALPLNLAPSATVTIQVAFSPNGPVGALSAQLTITEAGTNTTVGLYGLSAPGLEGSNEPALNAIVQTLGYTIDVGGTQLILPTGPNPIGDEVLVPLFQQAGSGVVTLQPVARYSPSGPLAYGYYVPDGTTASIQEVGTIAGNQGQALNPTLSAGTLTFNPGAQTFGFYADVTSYAAQKTFTEDFRNTGPLAHAVRTYPVKNRSGAPVANTYLVCMEPASNGDYQDYVFLVSNVKPATQETGLIDNVQVATGKPYVLAPLQVSTTHYIDRPYTVTSVPSALAGATLIKTANDDKTNSGGWSTWNETEVTVALAAGVNQVRATATGQSGANVDYLTVSSVVGSVAARTMMAAYRRSSQQAANLSSEPGLGVYPNPATSSVTLTTAGLQANQPVRISVTGIRGNTVWERVVDGSPNTLSYSLSTERFPAGVYFIRVTQGQTTAVGRLVKY